MLQSGSVNGSRLFARRCRRFGISAQRIGKCAARQADEAGKQKESSRACTRTCAHATPKETSRLPGSPHCHRLHVSPFPATPSESLTYCPNVAVSPLPKDMRAADRQPTCIRPPNRIARAINLWLEHVAPTPARRKPLTCNSRPALFSRVGRTTRYPHVTPLSHASPYLQLARIALYIATRRPRLRFAR